jgi:hypothetical protein
MVRIPVMRQAGVMHLPGPFRAAVGLVAVAADEARHLPDRALELPMLAVSTALQASIRAQQRYARLTARGDQLLSRQPTTDEPPAWATFDESPPAAQLPRSRSPFDDADTLDAADTATAAAQMIGDLFGVPDPVGSNPNGGRASQVEPRTPPAKKAPARTDEKTPAEKTSAEKAPAKKTPATKTPAKKTTAAAKAPAKKSASRSSAANKAAGTKAAARGGAAKTATKVAKKTVAERSSSLSSKNDTKTSD